MGDEGQPPSQVSMHSHGVASDPELGRHDRRSDHSAGEMMLLSQLSSNPKLSQTPLDHHSSNQLKLQA